MGVNKSVTIKAKNDYIAKHWMYNEYTLNIYWCSIAKHGAIIESIARKQENIERKYFKKAKQYQAKQYQT